MSDIVSYEKPLVPVVIPKRVVLSPESIRKLEHFKRRIIFQYTRANYPKSYSWLAQAFGLSESTIRRALINWGIPPKPTGIKDQSVRLERLKEEIIKDYALGLSAKVIGDKYGFGESTVQLNLKKWGITARNHTKVTADDIRGMIAAGVPIRDIAKNFDTKPSTIYRIRKEKLFITSSKKKRFSSLEERLIRNFYSRGLSISQIYRILKNRNLLRIHESAGPLRQFIEVLRLHRGNPPIVSNEQLFDILGLAKQGVSTQVISDKLIIPDYLISDVLKQFAPRRFAHVQLKKLPDKEMLINRIREMRINGASREVIMTATGLSPTQLDTLVAKYHIPGGQNKRYSKELLNQLALKIREMRLNKATKREIAIALNINEVLIGKIIKDYRIPYVKRVFDDATREKIKELYLRDIHYTNIAGTLGLKEDSVREEIGRMGLPKRDKPWNLSNQAYTPEEHAAQDDFIRKYYVKPYYRSIGELSRLLKIDKTTIRNRLEKMNIPIRSNLEGKRLRWVKRPRVIVSGDLKPLLHKRAIMLGKA